MANSISLNEKTPVSERIVMSNGLTGVFINVIGLSGSRLAKTADEKRLIVWILEKNQSAVGIGTVGFDLCEMPWNKQFFDENKEFMLLVLAGAKKKWGWETLDYEPNEPFLFPCIDQFAKLIQQMTPDDIDWDSGREWERMSFSDDPVFVVFQGVKNMMYYLLFLDVKFVWINGKLLLCRF